MKLFPYQREGIDRIKELNGRVLLADSMGLGKSVQSLKFLQETPSALPAVIICPAIVKWHWESEAFKHCGMRAAVLEGFKGGTKGTGFPLYITNYDILSDQRRQKRLRKGRLGFLRSLKPKTVIVDECAGIKNRKAKRSKAVRTLCKEAEHVLMLSGTPLVNRPAELYNSLNILWPDAYPSFWSYCRRFCNPKRTAFGWDVSGAANLHILHRELKEHGMIRRKPWQVLEQLPKKREIVLPVDIERPEEYEQAKGDFVSWIRKESPQAAKRAAKAEELNRIGYLKRLVADLKMKEVLTWIDGFLEADEGKLAVFAIHRKVIGAIRERYGKSCVVIDGSVPPKKRKEAIAKFQGHSKTRIFVGNIQAAGAGTDGLQRACSTGLFAELPWTPGEVSQVIGRLARIGQLNPVTFYFLVGKGTIEEELCKMLTRKEKILGKTLDGEDGKVDLNIYKRLMESLKGESK